LKFIALSQFTVIKGMEEPVKEAFLSRPHFVDQAPGYIRMEVLCPQQKPEEFWLLTWWQDEASYLTWHHSHEYRASHKYMPKGLKLVPKTAKVTFLEQISL
jgi:heme-degrading monooxygenase HmoA